ncbi:hypothetical protein MMC17_007984 [Xylographa soralifera]|nr:hypothetical protein [Xylographa soralifera]
MDACQASFIAWSDANQAYSASIFAGESAGIYSTSKVVEYVTIYSYDLSNIETATFSLTTVTAQLAISTIGTITTTTSWFLTDVIISPEFDDPAPPCYEVSVSTPTGCSECYLVASTIQLIYFPVSTVSGSPSLAITSMGTSVPTEIYDGETYTSGSVYIKFDTLRAVDACNIPLGSMYSNVIVTLRSDEVSSLRYTQRQITESNGELGLSFAYLGPYSFNYGDLNPPVPYSAWAGQFGSFGLIETFGAYNPYVSIPSAAQYFDPAWANCTIDPNSGFSWDPPYALTPIEGPQTEPNYISTSTAVPANTPTSPYARSTPWVLSSQSAGAMSPSISKAADPAALSESTATSAAAPVDPSKDQPSPNTVSSSWYIQSADPASSIRESQSESSSKPSFSAKVVLTISKSVITAITIPDQETLPGQTTLPEQTMLPGQTTLSQPSSVTRAALILIVDSKTLIPGSQILVSGTTYSLLPTPSAVIVDGYTVNLSPGTDFITLTYAMTVGTFVTTENSAFTFVVKSQTLTSEEEHTASSDVVSMDVSATDIVYGGTSTQGLAVLIMSGFEPVGRPSGPSTNANITLFTGNAAGTACGWWIDIIGIRVLISVVLVPVVTLGL